MDRISMICHMYGWGVPAILTLVALLTHSIEADELTSVCLPGKFYIIQSRTFVYILLLNNPYLNWVTLREQNLP